MTLATAKTFLEMSGADREAGDIVKAAGVKISSSDPKEEEQGYAGYARYIRGDIGRFPGGCAGTGHAGGCMAVEHRTHITTVHAGGDTTGP